MRLARRPCFRVVASYPGAHGRYKVGILSTLIEHWIVAPETFWEFPFLEF